MTDKADNDALVRKLEAAILGADSADHLRDKGLWDTARLVETAAEVLAAIAALDRHPAGDDALREENARLRGLVDALAVLMPIQVHDGRDYAEVFFAVGATHSTQAMTMNPQHWRDLADAYDRAALTGRQG